MPFLTGNFCVFPLCGCIPFVPFCAQVNSSLMSSDCSERCCCSPSTGLTCYAAGCTSGRVCEIQAGVRDCRPAKGLCSLSVGANLTTFDGARNAIHTPGVYELSSRCPGLQTDVPWYRVVADVKPCQGHDKVVGEVHIFFQDGVITVTPGKGVWVSTGTEGRVDFPGLSFSCHGVLATWWSCSLFSSSRSALFLDLSLYVSLGPSPFTFK